MKNFGFASETMLVAPGINAKINEFQAGLGFVQLKYLNQIVNERQAIAKCYKELLKAIHVMIFNSPEQIRGMLTQYRLC